MKYMFCFILLQNWFYVHMKYNISVFSTAAIALQEPARLVQHLFYFIAYETTPLSHTI